VRLDLEPSGRKLAIPLLEDITRNVLFRADFDGQVISQ
jgi:hypothetical protein